MPAVIVFDLFDTLVDLLREELPLVDWGEGPTRSTIGALHELVQPVNGMALPEFAAAVQAADAALLRAHWAEDREVTTEQRFFDMLERLGLEGEEGLAEQLTAAHVGWLARVASTPPHHAALLQKLRETHRLAICSNFSHTPTALAILERDGLLHHFAAVVVSADVGFRKPDRRIFEKVLEELDVEPADALHVGDKLEKDVAGAAPLGFATAWLTRRVADPQKARLVYDGPPPQHTLPDLRALFELARDGSPALDP